MVVVEDNGPGIVKAQAPKIFGKLLYGSKFHRLKQSRGQQGIGISAAAMYGQLTTGQPIRVTSRIGKGKPAHYFEIQIDTRKNNPVVTEDRRELARLAPGARHPGRAGDRGQLAAGAAVRQPLRRAHRPLQPALHLPLRPPPGRAAHLPAGHRGAAQGGAGDQAAPARRRAGRPDGDGGRLQEPRRQGLPPDRLLARLRPGGRGDRQAGRLQGEGPAAEPGRGPGAGRPAPPGHRRDQDHGAADPGALAHRRRADEARGWSPSSTSSRPRGRRRTSSSTSTRPRRRSRRGRRRRPRPRPPSVPDAPPEEGVEKIKGHNYFIATVTRPPKVYRGNPFQVEVGLAYGGSWPADKPIELFRFANRVPLLFQRGRLRHDRGDRQDRLAALPALPAPGLAAGRPHGAPGPHRQRLGAVHQRGQGGGGPLPGDHPGDPAGGPGVRAQAGRPHPQEEAPRLPGPAPKHLRALHPGGGPGHRQDHQAEPGPDQARVPAAGRQGHRAGAGRAGRGAARSSRRGSPRRPRRAEEEQE